MGLRRRSGRVHPAPLRTAGLTDMRILVATVYVPFIRGGAELLTEGLVAALTRSGHEVDVLRVPFRFSPPGEVLRVARLWESRFFTDIAPSVERVICLKFPTYYMRHPRKVAWLLHQHRAVYDLWMHEHDAEQALPSRREITSKDRSYLAGCEPMCTISKAVSARLWHYNQVPSRPLYHPPPHASRFFCEEPERFIYCPSRIEQHKRQWLLLEALTRTRNPVRVTFAGTGGAAPELAARARAHGLSDRIELLGHVPEERLRDLYARSLGVFFGPYEEDYGYVTLEAMLSSKPVITCVDSGGPTEFVIDGESGAVVAPTPDAVAGALDRLWENESVAVRLGLRGRALYDDLDISWDKVVGALVP